MGKGQAVAGLVLSIIAVVLGVIPAGGITSIISLPVAIIGLVLAAVGGKKLKANGQGTGLATAGLVLGIIGTVICGILFFTCGICVLAAGGVVDGILGL